MGRKGISRENPGAEGRQAEEGHAGSATGHADCAGQGTRIIGVEPEGIAAEMGIAAGDFLLSINGEEIHDIFDYRFQMAEETIRVLVRKPDGSEWEIDIEKEESEDLGLDFEQPLMDAEQRCTNDCVFCFIDQLPTGMRETLYFKDDDSRLSFLYGNYITMTNMKEAELDRIIRYRMSPVNVSVHATNPELRVRMLGNRFAGNILDRVRKLCEAEIRVNAQIVLCRGMNDGAELERTLDDLCGLGAFLNSVSVVPVGLTRYRTHLSVLEPFDAASAAAVLEAVHARQTRRLVETGSRTVYAADEFYIMAGVALPEAEAYEDFPQIENGVGMLASFLADCRSAMETDFPVRGMKTNLGRGRSVKRATQEASPFRRVGLVSGVSAAPFLRSLCEEIAARDGRLETRIFSVENRFFGEHVTVTGLLTGQDIAALLGEPDGETGLTPVSGLEELLLCRSMFKSGTELFLDDLTRAGLEEQLKVPCRIVENDGFAFLDAVCGV